MADRARSYTVVGRRPNIVSKVCSTEGRQGRAGQGDTEEKLSRAVNASFVSANDESEVHHDKAVHISCGSIAHLQ